MLKAMTATLIIHENPLYHPLSHDAKLLFIRKESKYRQ